MGRDVKEGMTYEIIVRVHAQGDNDPVDVVEIGSETCVAGGVYAVKPLAILAMIDDGELDWKVAAIRVDDPKANLVNDVEDVERCCCAVFPFCPHPSAQLFIFPPLCHTLPYPRSCRWRDEVRARAVQNCLCVAHRCSAQE